MNRFLGTQALICTVALLLTVVFIAADRSIQKSEDAKTLTGQAAFTDAAHEAPGIRRHLTVADLPAPAPDQSVDNGPTVVARPANAWPMAPKGFKVELYATGLDNPRLLRVAPNGDLFLAESETGKIKVFRGVGAGRQAAGDFCLRRGTASALRDCLLSPRGRIPSGSTSATPTRSYASLIRMAI